MKKEVVAVLGMEDNLHEKTNKKGFCIKIILLIVLLIYILMLIDIAGLLKQVEDVFLMKYSPEETEGTAIDRYNYSGLFGDVEFDSFKIQLLPIFVCHNFHDGYILAFYSYQAYDTEGNLITASLNVVTKWKIHKADGKWEIVEISERP